MSCKIKHGNTTFQGEQLKKIEIKKECDLLSVSLIESVCDFELNVSKDEEAVFDDNEPFVIYNGNKAEMVTYLETYKRTGAKSWSIATRDSIGRLENFEFEGDVYFEKNAKELIEEIFAKTDIQVVMSEDIANMVVSGQVPYTTCREALSHVLFALGCYARPAVLNGSACVEIKQYYENTQRTPETIPASRVLSGVISVASQKVYGVEVVSHGYEDNEDFGRVGGVRIPRNTESGEVFTIVSYVDFDPPIVTDTLHLNGSAQSKVKIVRASANFAELEVTSANVAANFVGLYAREYVVSESLQGKYSSTSNNGQIIAVEGKTLVNNENINDVIERCYEYYINPKELSAKVVIGKHVADDGTVTFDNDVQCGDMVTIPTDYQGTYTGRVIKEQYNLNGNIIIKEITVK